MSSRVMSADCHMDVCYLPPDAFTARMDAARWGDGIPRVIDRNGEKIWVPDDPVHRRADQERDGIDAEIIYGILGISRGLLGGKGIGEHALLSAVYHAYNQSIAEFNQTMPGHYFGLGCLPNHDAQAAAEEVRYCASLGLKGATIVPWGAAMPMWHDMWEPVWATAEALDFVITFHVFE